MVVGAVAQVGFVAGRPDGALSLLVAKHGLLRPGEAPNLQWRDLRLSLPFHSKVFFELSVVQSTCEFFSYYLVKVLKKLCKVRMNYLCILKFFLYT